MATSEGNFRRTARAYLPAIDKYNGTAQREILPNARRKLQWSILR